jgi:hypothetical protein
LLMNLSQTLCQVFTGSNQELLRSFVFRLPSEAQQ